MPSRAEVRALAADDPGKTAVMRQREEEARRAGRAPRSVQAWVPLSRISRHLIHAVVSAEDQKFFGHEGVDWDAIKESVEKNRARRRFARGGSTITQQLAKNLFFSTRKSLPRKARELVVASWLEQDLSKRRILELYLNVIEWGDGLYGCQAAAQRYYGRSCAELGPDEAAGLAAMIPNPRRLNPAVNASRHSRAQRRVLWLMARAGYLGQQAGGLGAEPPPVEEAEYADEEEGADLAESAKEAERAEPAVAPEPGTEPAVETASPAPSPDETPSTETEPSSEPPPPHPSPAPTPTPPPSL